MLQVDLTEYEENHDFVFDAVLNEDVSNEEVSFPSSDSCPRVRASDI